MVKGRMPKFYTHCYVCWACKAVFNKSKDLQTSEQFLKEQISKS